MTVHHERRVVTTRRHEYTLNTPVSASDLADSVNAALKDARDALRDASPNNIEVRAYDGAIVLSWNETVQS